MTFQVYATGHYERDLARLPKDVRERVVASYDALAQDPFHKRPGADIKMMRAATKQYRLRIGDYRVSYKVVDKNIYLTSALHRSHAYD